MPSFDLSELDNSPNAIMDAIRAGEWEKVGTLLAEKLNEAMDSIPWENIHKKAKEVGKGLADLINGFVKTTKWNDLGETIANGINTAIYFSANFLKTLNFDDIGQAIGDTINGLFMNIDWDELAEGINAKVIRIFNLISTALETVDFSGIAETIFNFFKNIDYERMILAGAEVIYNFIQGIIDSAPKIIETGVMIIVRLLNGMSMSLPTLIPKAVECVMTIARTILANLPTIITAGINVIIALVQGFADSLPTIIEFLPELIGTFVGGIVTLLPIIINAGIQIIIALVTGLIQALPDIVLFIPRMIDAFIMTIIKNLPLIIDSGVRLIVALIEGLAKAIPTLVFYVPIIVGKIVDTIIAHKDELIDAGIRIIYALMDGFDRVKGALATAVWNLATNSIKNKITEITGNAWQWGVDMVNGFIDGIRSLLWKVRDTASSVASNVKSYLHFSRPDVGPLRDYETYMPDFVEGLTNTLNASAPLLVEATRNLAEKMSQGLSVDDSIAINKQLSFGMATTGVTTGNMDIQSSFRDIMIEALTGTEQEINIPIKFEIGGETLIDTIINGINEKTQRLGRDVLMRVGE